jgi:pectate lyase
MKELLRLNHTLAVALLCCVLLFVGALHSFAQLSPYDENAPVGWASIGQECTGSNNQNPVVVTSEEEIRAAMQACKGGKASKTIYISGQFEVKEKLRYDKMQNCTIYGLPGSALINRSHNDNPDYAGFFYCQNWENCIIRNVTLLGAGAYDISAADNIQLVESKNIWIDHCDIQDGVDGNLDAKTKSDNMTISWCKFSYLIAPWARAGESDDHRCSSMWGSSDNRGDDEGSLNATFVNNWWYHGCGQRCPRIRFGKVHIANCLWENGTEDDPAQYCIGIGHSSKMYIENGDFTQTVIKSGQSNMRGHNKYFLQDNKLYHFTMTGCLGEDDAVEIGKGYTGTVYNPYNDATYKCRVYDASLVADILRNPENGAGATLDEDLLSTRGNEHYGEVTAIKGVKAADDAQVIGIKYYNLNGAQLLAPQKGVNILEFQMSDGTTRTNKIYK